MQPASSTTAEPRGTGTLAAVFEEQAARAPYALAVVGGEGEELTYGELDRRANGLARSLRDHGVGRGTIVGLCARPRSPDLAVGVFAVLKAGAAWLPLDAAYPRPRLAFMLEDSGASALLLDASAGEPPPFAGPVLPLDAAAEDDGPAATAAPDDLAYVVYTSGSTGTPKGVCVSHGNVLPLLRWARGVFGLGPRTRTLQTLSHSFDFGVYELLATCLYGGTLYVREGDFFEDLPAVVAYANASRVNHLCCTPSMLGELVREGVPFTDLEIVHVGGEELSWRLVEDAASIVPAGCRLFNGYGPTEATVTATLYPVERRRGRRPSRSVPIGFPAAETTVHLLGPDGLPAALGEVGELHLGGPGVTRGYLDRPRLTAERFVPGPAGGRLYRTGDLARALPDGALEFLGRVDDQVKIRGHRIELGEVEAAIASDPAVREAAVVVRGEGADKQLVAYLVGDGDGAEAAGRVWTALRDRLPAHLVPSALVPVETLPRSPGGKLDRRALAELDLPARGRRPSEPPRTATERAVAGVCAEVLEVDEVGIHDDLFRLGLASLRAARIAGRVERALGVPLRVDDVARAATAAELARAVDERAQEAAPAPRAAPASGPAPLSPSQEIVWFFQQLDPASTAYTFAARLELAGRLEVEALRRAFDLVVERHELLRTTFPEHDGEPVQLVHPEARAALRVVDVPGERALEEVVARTVREPFDVESLPLVRWTLARLGDERHVLVHHEHHLVHDGWSFNVLLRELWTAYRSLVEGAEPALSELEWQFADYARWERDRWERRASSELEFWARKLDGAPPFLPLPADRPRPPVQRFRGTTIRETLDPRLGAELRAYCHREGATLFSVMLAAFLALLHRYTRARDLVVGSALANRSAPQAESLIGMLVNTIALRVDVRDDPTLRELVARAGDAVWEGLAHGGAPIQKVVEAMRVERDLSRNPLFQTVFSFHDTPLPRIDVPGLEIRVTEGVDDGSTKFDLDVVVIPEAERTISGPPGEAAGGLLTIWEYSTDLFDEATVRRLTGCYRDVLEALLEDPGQRVSEVRLADDPEPGEAAHEPEPAACLHELFEEQARRRPDAVALVDGERQVTYGELDALAGKLADRLRAVGVGPGRLVAVLLDRSPELVAALLAVLKAGGAFLPLDPLDPQERLDALLEDAAPALVLTADRLAGLLGDTDDAQAGAAAASPLDLAYVVYTSGSTGAPKGVAVPHAAAARFFRTARDLYRLGPGDRVLQVSSIRFDQALEEILAPLVAGAAVVLAGPEPPDAARLAELVRLRGVTVLDLPTAYWRRLRRERLLEEPLEGVRLVVLGGEALSAESVAPFLPCNRLLQGRGAAGASARGRPRIVNTYGPTEATIVATSFEADGRWDGLSGTGTVPIGRPLPGVSAYVLDERLHPVPPGAPGELHLGGGGLARGYLGRPGRTAARFLPDPYSRERGARMYRTGDLVRLRPDGSLEFLGRVDRQVKVSGFRVEPAEVEAALERHPAVAEAAVTVAEEDGEARLAAAVALEGTAEATEAELRRHLRARLPAYMLPASIAVVGELPRARGGKPDYEALPAPDRARRETAAGYVAPRTHEERVVAAIWAQALNLERVGVEDDIFELGGHSLVAARIAGRMREALHVPVALSAVFQHPTVAELTAAVVSGNGDG